MRDFRDAKAMAHSLRVALAAKGFKITVSQSLELIAHAFGVADWNTLAAAIHRETLTTPKGAASPRPRPPNKSTLRRALNYANERKHEYMTLEHLLLALTDHVNASGVMNVCDVNLGVLRENLASYIDNELKTLVIDDGRKCRPTPAFQRVVRRAVLHAQGLGRGLGRVSACARSCGRTGTSRWRHSPTPAPCGCDSPS